jgi:hypothetical protein
LLGIVALEGSIDLFTNSTICSSELEIVVCQNAKVTAIINNITERMARTYMTLLCPGKRKY